MSKTDQGPSFIENVDGVYHKQFKGSLTKRSRERGFLRFGENWRKREFTLEGQWLTYFGENGAKKGAVYTRNCKTSKIRADQLNGRENSFAIELSYELLPDGGYQESEFLFLEAPDEASRAKWMSHLNASSLSANWKVSNTLIKNKRGCDIAKQLLSQSDDSSGMASTILVNTLAKVSRDIKIKEAVKEIQAAKDAVDRNRDGWDKDVKELNSKLNALKFEKSVSVLQQEVRIFLSKCRHRKQMRTETSARILTRALRKHSGYQFRKRLIRERNAKKVIRNLLVAYLSRSRRLKYLKTHGQVFSLDLVKATHLISANDSTSKVFAYSMSCVDKSGMFKGTQSTDIKEGYGLKSLCLHQSSLQNYSHDPVWEDEDVDIERRTKEKCYLLNTTSDSYIVVTLMAVSALNETKQSYLGQAIVKISDHERDIYNLNRTVPFKDVPLRNYVAPVEDPDGVSPFSINSALKVRNITGTVSFNLKLVDTIHQHTGHLHKISNSSLVMMMGSNKFKSRFFVLMDDHLFYNKVENLLTNKEPKHILNLSTVTEIKVKDTGGERSIDLTWKPTATSEPLNWKLLLSKDKVSYCEYCTWLRRIYHGCAKVVDPEIAELSSKRTRKRLESIEDRIEVRYRARSEARVNTRGETVHDIVVRKLSEKNKPAK
jgi:hypothetical protein